MATPGIADYTSKGKSWGQLSRDQKLFGSEGMMMTTNAYLASLMRGRSYKSVGNEFGEGKSLDQFTYGKDSPGYFGNVYERPQRDAIMKQIGGYMRKVARERGLSSQDATLQSIGTPMNASKKANLASLTSEPKDVGLQTQPAELPSSDLSSLVGKEEFKKKNQTKASSLV